MLELLTMPPPPEVIAKLTAIKGVRIAPTVLTTQQGPDGHLGPEAAGAVLILQATFVDKQGAERFWLKAAELFELLAAAPGFIRRFSFADGPLGMLIAFWRTAADAHAFFSSNEHQAAMRDLYRQRWQYSTLRSTLGDDDATPPRHLLPALRRRNPRDRKRVHRLRHRAIRSLRHLEPCRSLSAQAGHSPPVKTSVAANDCRPERVGVPS